MSEGTALLRLRHTTLTDRDMDECYCQLLESHPPAHLSCTSCCTQEGSVWGSTNSQDWKPNARMSTRTGVNSWLGYISSITNSQVHALGRCPQEGCHQEGKGLSSVLIRQRQAGLTPDPSDLVATVMVLLSIYVAKCCRLRAKDIREQVAVEKRALTHHQLRIPPKLSIRYRQCLFGSSGIQEQLCACLASCSDDSEVVRQCL